MKKFITFLFTVHCLLLTVHLSEAQIIHVPADLPTIQAGIVAASDGDTVLVAGGTYFENINFMGKAITVASNFILDSDTNHINNTIIDGSQPDDPDYGSVVSFFTAEDSTSVLCGFTITGGTGMVEPVYGARIGGGISCYYATAKIIHNKITGNVVNSATNAWGAGIAFIRETGDGCAAIESNIISNNMATATNAEASGGGIEVWGKSRISNNIIKNNGCVCTLGIGDGGGVVMRSINTPADTVFFFNNEVHNNSVDAYSQGLGGGIISDSYANISGSTIKFNSVSSPNMSLGGGVCILYSNSLFTDNEISHNSVSGFETHGGGINFYNPENTELIDNFISYNSCITDNSWFGAGVCCIGPSGITNIIGNDLAYNNGPVQPVGGGGGLWINDALETLVTIDRNRFRNNEAYNGGGFFERSCYNVTLTNNIFSGNHANFAASAAFYHPNLKAAETIMENKVSEVRIYNNTFKSNTADTKGGAIRFQGDLNIPKIMNCIFWLNSAPSIVNDGIGILDISYSDIDTNVITGWWDGEGNIDLDPLFMTLDPFYHLSSVSPCINTGTQNMSTPIHDFDGEDRPDPEDGLTDIGADEFWDVPETPVALDPDTIGFDYFVACWHRSIPLALGYKLDVAYDMNFEEFVPGYENLDVGEDTSKMVINLAGLDCYYRVRAYNAVWISPNSDTIFVIWNGVETHLIPISDFQFQIFPNPTKGIFELQFTVYNLQSVSLKIFDLRGREVVAVLDKWLPAGEHTVRFDLTGLPAGVYFVRLQAGREVATGKVVLYSR